MSKKTRKQKILADQKRQLFLTNQISYTPQAEKKISNQELKPAKEKSDQSLSIYSYPIQLVRKDLTKTLLLCILAISLEVALYFILEKNLVLSLVNF